MATVDPIVQHARDLRAEAPVLPRWLGRYHLFDRIGQGGMAEIYLARAATELGGGRLCVVKQILAAYAGMPEFAEMLINEAKLAARLDHANVVQVLDLVRHDDVLFIAMQYVEGLDLSALLRLCARTKTRLPVEYGVLVAIEALRGLDYAHRRTDDRGRPLGIVHRDVSPSNVLVSFEGEVKLCDFGIARANDFASVLPDDAIQGKAGYMSPEHARGEDLDARADVFALGIVLWELLAGRRLYRAPQVPGDPSLLDQAREADVPSLPARNLPYESELFGIVERALARDRDARHPSAAAMLRELEGWAVRAGRMANPIRFGDWLTETFGSDLLASRRARERAVRAIEQGPVVQISRVVAPEADAALPSPEPSPSPLPAVSDETSGVRRVSLDEVESRDLTPPSLAALARLVEKPAPGATSRAPVPRDVRITMRSPLADLWPLALVALALAFAAFAWLRAH